MNIRPILKTFHRTDEVLKGFTFGYLMVQLQKRKIRLTRDKVREIFGEYIQRHAIDAGLAFEDHLDDMMEKLERSSKGGLWQ